jgi:phosphoribosylformimino-5-aminoimidazole carboxamide ribonucleotide (ProFAR) isomerase
MFNIECQRLREIDEIRWANENIEKYTRMLNIAVDDKVEDIEIEGWINDEKEIVNRFTKQEEIRIETISNLFKEMN